jgi:hypothetical protein
MPGDSQSPVLLALALTAIFAGAIWHIWWFVTLSALAAGVVIIAWLWPEPKLGETAQAVDA